MKASRNQQLDGPEAGASMDGPSLFYERAMPAAVRLAVTLVDAVAIAEDIVQDAFAEVWLRWERIESPESYLRACVVNRCRKELRRREVMRRRVPFAAPVHVDDDASHLADAIRKLSPRRRAVVVLRFYEDMSEAQIAQTLGIRPGTVKATLHQALAQLREVVER